MFECAVWSLLQAHSSLARTFFVINLEFLLWMEKIDGPLSLSPSWKWQLQIRSVSKLQSLSALLVIKKQTNNTDDIDITCGTFVLYFLFIVLLIDILPFFMSRPIIFLDFGVFQIYCLLCQYLSFSAHFSNLDEALSCFVLSGRWRVSSIFSLTTIHNGQHLS